MRIRKKEYKDCVETKNKEERVFNTYENQRGSPTGRTGGEEGRSGSWDRGGVGIPPPPPHLPNAASETVLAKNNGRKAKTPTETTSRKEEDKLRRRKWRITATEWNLQWERVALRGEGTTTKRIPNQVKALEEYQNEKEGNQPILKRALRKYQGGDPQEIGGNKLGGGGRFTEKTREKRGGLIRG